MPDTDFTTPKLTIAELYTITTVSGLVARFTNHSENIIIGINTYQAIPSQRTQISYHSDLTVDKVDLTFGLIGLKVGTQQLTIPQVVKGEFLKGARVVVQGIDYVAMTTPVSLFEGWVTGGVSYTMSTITMSVGSILDKLKESFPKLIFSEHCQHQLFDGLYGTPSFPNGCNLDPDNALYKFDSVAGADSTRWQIYSDIFLGDCNFNKGKILFTGGLNTGITKGIQWDIEAGSVKMIIPFPFDIVPGDAFTAWVGCDKQGVTCDTKFGNYGAFWGFEYIPMQEVLYGSIYG